jgi:prepilin-type N-terminal cleavage/methylation domain-containing protein
MTPAATASRSRGGDRTTRLPHARGDRGFTLIEIVVAIGVTLTLLALVPVVIQAVSDAAAFSQGTSAGGAQSINAIEQLESRVESASQICLPTSMTTVGPNVSAGFGLRVQTIAFGKSLWDQWIVNTSSDTLQEQDWSTTWVSGDAVPAWTTVATNVINSSTVPFSLPTVSSGSPQTLSMDLQVTETYAHKSQAVEFKAVIAAFSTPYTSSPPVACSTASTQEGWT